MDNRDLMLQVFLHLGYDQDTIHSDGKEAGILRNNPTFNRAVAEYKFDLLTKEDSITANPTMDRLEANKYREYYSMLRILLDGLVNTLEQKMMLLENESNHIGE